MSTATLTVIGMTCGHCASSVREKIGNITGVEAVNVDLASGAVSIDSDTPVDTNAIKNAVEEAGYSSSAEAIYRDGDTHDCSANFDPTPERAPSAEPATTRHEH